MSEWIKWDARQASGPDHRPEGVSEETEVFIETYGAGPQDDHQPAHEFYWNHDKDIPDSSIVAYRIYDGMADAGGLDVISLLILAREENGVT